MAEAPVMFGADGVLPLDLPRDGSTLVPGVLPAQWIRKNQRRLLGGRPLEDGQIQPASLDLRLGRTAYRIFASFLPGHQASVEDKIGQLTTFTLDLSSPQILQRGSIYLIEIEETLNLSPSVSAMANPKSSTGRLDIFTRVLADGSDVFDAIPAHYKGRLWAEVSPRTFDILVRRGTRLSQLRFRRRNPSQHRYQTARLSDRDLEALHNKARLTDENPIIRGGLNLRVNLVRDNGSDVIAYKAKRIANFIDLDKINHYRIDDFWESIKTRRKSDLILEPGEFYILASKEKVHIPHDHAAEMLAIDPIMGEFRVHYAGFFDPGFGQSPSHGPGSKAVLEVRTYDFPFFLEDGQTIGRLVFEPMTEPPATSYGSAIDSNYQGQRLKLSKHFRADD